MVMSRPNRYQPGSSGLQERARFSIIHVDAIASTCWFASRGAARRLARTQIAPPDHQAGLAAPAQSCSINSDTFFGADGWITQSPLKLEVFNLCTHLGLPWLGSQRRQSTLGHYITT